MDTRIILDDGATPNAVGPTLPIPVSEPLDYIDIGASSSETFGALGTVLSHISWAPASTSPGAITIDDGGDGAVTRFFGGAGSVVTLDARTIIEGARSRFGAWTVTTGANMTARVFYRE